MKKNPFLLGGFLFFLVFLFLSPSKIFAQDDLVPLKPQDIELHTWTQISFQDIGSALSCQLTGNDPRSLDGSGCVGYDEKGELKRALKPTGGAVAFVGNLIGALYTFPPASSGEYFAYLKEKLGLPAPVYAQAGTGFSGLKPLLRVWKGMRDAAYLFFIVIFLATGLAMMFRAKINPQTVISIQNSLPRVVIALLLVTFSYAIAALMIDFMYLLIFLLFSLFKGAGVSVGDLPSTLQGKNVFELWWGIEGLGRNIISAPADTVRAVVESVVGLWGVKTVVGFLTEVLAYVIIGLAVLWALFRLFFTLLMAYINALVDIIFAPLAFVLNALPGGNGFFILRDLAGNLLAFPLTIALFLLASALLNLDFRPQEPPWVPPLLIGGGGYTIDIFKSFIALGFILITPTVVQMAKDAVKAPKFPYGTAIGQALGVGPGVAGAGIRTGFGIYQWVRGPLWARQQQGPLGQQGPQPQPPGG